MTILIMTIRYDIFKKILYDSLSNVNILLLTYLFIYVFIQIEITNLSGNNR